MENQLIQLYLLVCRFYDNQSSLKSQRLSNFKPRFTDQELVTVYLFGHLNRLFQKKAIYRFLRNYRADWFPALPSYQAFCNRLNNLESSFQVISQELLHGVRLHLLAAPRGGRLPTPSLLLVSSRKCSPFDSFQRAVTEFAEHFCFWR